MFIFNYVQFSVYTLFMQYLNIILHKHNLYMVYSQHSCYDGGSLSRLQKHAHILVLVFIGNQKVLVENKK